MMKITKGDYSCQATWCVARPSTSSQDLQKNIDYVCTRLGDCRMIAPGGACYEPNTLISRASVVMNLYYQQNKRNFFNCDFSGSAIVAVTDPSYGNCKYKFQQ
uniref:major pollen allergen Ole e 10-like n=1 Tax=Erigeron canadensis TaxID=72917 RepID=UPI001CB93A1D|nr:major pollen allergen Ole e 10-like [Erigeron canadensis]